MKMPKPLIAAMGVLLVGVAPLLQAAPGQGDEGPGNSERSDGQYQQGPQAQQGQPGGYDGGGHDDRGYDRGPEGQGGPPQDFGPIRDRIAQHQDYFGRGQPLPPGVDIERGRPLPPGYDSPLDPRAERDLPHYDGYQWRRMGTDVVLVAIGTGLVYEVLNGVLR